MLNFRLNVHSVEFLMSAIVEKDKRTAILEATLELIAERGFHGTPMSQVAKRSSVSAGIIYHYFENKDDLIHQLYRHIKIKFSEALIEGFPLDASWDDNFKHIWMNAYYFYVKHPQETLVLEQYENSPYAQAWHEKTDLDENMRMLIGMIESQIEAGNIHPMPMEVLYELSFGVALSLAKRQIVGTLKIDAIILDSAAKACLRAVSI
jgi:TetR/AcrR family transcriptional regulator, repressor of fatR-cypB operon